MVRRVTYVEDDLETAALLNRQAGRPADRAQLQKDFLESGSAGNDQIVVASPNNEIWQNVINIQTEDRKSIPLTISLTGALVNTGPLKTLDFNLIARIKWGVRGSFAEALIDFINGYCLTVCASSLSVDIRNISSGGSPAGDVMVGAFVSKGAGSVQKLPRFTDPTLLEVLAGANSGLIPVPDFGTTYELQYNNSTGGGAPVGPILIAYLSGASGVLFAETLGAGQRHFPRNLPRECVYVRLTNNDPAAALTGKNVFEIAI